MPIANETNKLLETLANPAIDVNKRRLALDALSVLVCKDIIKSPALCAHIAVQSMALLANPNDNAEIRAETAALVGNAGARIEDDEALQTRVVDALLAALNDPARSPYLREYAVLGLGNFFLMQREDTPLLRRALPRLVRLLTDETTSGSVTDAAKWALVKVGAPAVPPLLDALDSENPYVRWVAAVTLGAIGELDAVGPLIRALEDADDFVPMAAAAALEDIGTPEARAAVEAWRSKRWGG